MIYKDCFFYLYRIVEKLNLEMISTFDNFISQSSVLQPEDIMFLQSNNVDINYQKIRVIYYKTMKLTSLISFDNQFQDCFILSNTGKIACITAIYKSENSCILRVKPLHIVPLSYTNLQRTDHPQYITYSVNSIAESEQLWKINECIRKCAVLIQNKTITYVSVIVNNVERD